MFYWEKFFIEANHYDSRLSNLSPAHRVVFSSGCALHAIMRFERLRIERIYQPSSPRLLSDLLAVIGDILQLNSRLGVQKVGTHLDDRLARLAEAVCAGTGAYNESELLGAVAKTVQCLVADGSLRFALLAAENSYVAVSKYYDARAFPGEARTVELILQFEKQSPECSAELAFQVELLTALVGAERLPETCDGIMDLFCGNRPS